MTTYSCPHCGRTFQPEDYGEFPIQGQIVVATKSYAAALTHIASCPENPKNASSGSSRGD